MKAAIGNKHQAVIKMVKKLDHDLMIRNLPDKFTESTTLSSICIDQLSKSITLNNCLELLEFADLHQVDEFVYLKDLEDLEKLYFKIIENYFLKN